MKFYWCWRCKAKVPMLEEHEWEVVKKAEEEMHAQAKKIIIEQEKCAAKWNDKFTKKDPIKEFEEHEAFGRRYNEIKLRFVKKRDKAFKKIMKEFDTKISPKCSIYNHARPLYGMECENCGKLLRGPSSTYCFECGWKKN